MVVVPSLQFLCLEKILSVVEARKFHPQLINDLCKYLQSTQHLLNPILEYLVEKKVITDVALSAFLVPDRSHLNLANCPHIKKSTLKQIGYNCHNLLFLDLSDCQQVSNAVVRGVLAGCGSLRELRLDRCRLVTDSAFDTDQSPFHMLVGCQSLENISMQGCNQITGKLAHTLTKTCRHLKALNLSQCKHICAPSIQSIFEHHQLLCLNLSFSDVISDESFMLLPCADSQAFQSPSSMGKLEQLTLAMSVISDVSLTRLAHTYQHSLLNLSLEWCCNISDEGVAVLVKECSLLADINLKACKNLSDHSVRAIARSCKHLLSLNLSWCSDITDDGILELTPTKRSAVVCSQLQSLCVMWTQMTGESLGKSGLQALPNLRLVQANGCGGIASQFVDVFEQKGINLTL